MIFSKEQVIIGGAPLGLHSMGMVSYNELESLFYDLLSSDYNHYDIAPIYGFGIGEKNLKKVLGNKIKNVFISGKFGLYPSGEKVTRNSCVRLAQSSLENSLSTLKREYFDEYLLHWYDNKTNLDSIFEFFESNKCKGLIKSYGFCNVSKQPLLFNNVVKRSVGISIHEEFNPFISRNWLSGILKQFDSPCLSLFGTLGQGYFTTDRFGISSEFINERRSKMIQFTKKFCHDNVFLNDKIRQLMHQYKVSIELLVLNFIKGSFSNARIICGFKNKTQFYNFECLNQNCFNLELYDKFCDIVSTHPYIFSGNKPSH